MEGESDLAHISRLKEEEELALYETREKVKQWQKFDDDYTALQDRLATLPDKVSHQIMVPFGKHAFMPGQLVHTNEIMVLLGDNWFAERSAKQACEIVDRRKKHVKTMMEDLEKQKYLLESRLGFVSDLKGTAEGRGDVVEIREEFNAEKEAKWKEERSAKKREAALSKTSPQKSQKKTPQVQHHKKVSKQPNTKTSSSMESKKKTSQSQHHREVTKQPDTSGSAPTPDELLLARLDELERQEKELDELEMSDEDDGEEGTEDDEDEYEEEEEEDEEDVVKKPEESDKYQPKHDPVSTQVKKDGAKHVHWKEDDESNSSPMSINLDQEEDDEDEEEEEEEVESRSSSSVIHFSHTNVPNEEPIQEEDAKDLSPRTPGQIYDLYAAMGKEGHNQPKSILKNPMPQQPAQRPHVPLQRERRQPLPAPLSAFTGSVVEHGPAEMDESGGSLPTVEIERPKRVSKFKAGRQGWR